MSIRSDNIGDCIYDCIWSIISLYSRLGFKESILDVMNVMMWHGNVKQFIYSSYDPGVLG